MDDQPQKNSIFDDDYWRKNYGTCQYLEKGNHVYEDYQLAYQTGHEGYDRYAGNSFDQVEMELKQDYEDLLSLRLQVGLSWEQVKDAVREAWDQAGTT